MSASSLLQRALAASPGQKDRKSRPWATLWPVYSALRSNGFSVETAIDWLVEQKEIKEADRVKARNAFYVLASRRRKQAKRATAPPRSE